MARIHIQRTHNLGLPKARKIAWQWAEEVEQKFDMECTVVEGEDGDTVEFKRTGVHGSLRVAADSFELDAQLGFLLGAFSRTIETEIEKNLDDLLARADGAPGTAKAPRAQKKVPAEVKVKASPKPAAKAGKRGK